MKKLPLAIQTFAEIREGNYLYIDKTEQILRMVQSAKANFLSRPRRFGKSLLVDTLKELFEGNQSLFNGLYIENNWDWSISYPVIKFDFAGGTIQNRQELDQRIHNLFELNQKRLGIHCTQQWDIAGCFGELIENAHQQYGQKVVILIDEYDKPILDNIESPEQAAEIREGLKNLYSVLKGQDAHIQFIFMTGVTKFSKVSLFSGINQIVDITLDQNYSTICGFTQSDLESKFTEHLNGVDWQQLKEWYNGYQFMGEPVYNPYDILLFISKGLSYRSYWFETGSPSFLLKLFQKHRYFLPNLEQIEVGEEILDSFDVEHINPITLLFQAGYLTIDQVYTDELGEQSFKLRIPNREVRSALNNQLIAHYSGIEEDRKTLRQSLFRCLNQGDLPTLEKEIIRLFSGIPWRNFTQNDLPDSEGYYASVIYAFFASLNATVIPEDISNKGQTDLTVILGNYIYVMELKRDQQEDYQLQTPNPALVQIQQRDYAKKYLNSGKQVFTLGLIFNTKTRNLVQMDCQTL